MAFASDSTSASELHGPVTSAIRAMQLEPEPAPAGRRLFLRALAALPFVGGGVAIVGAPEAVAEPVTKQMLREYHDWLMYERFMVAQELEDDEPNRFGPQSQFGSAWRWHRERGPIRQSESGLPLGDGVSFPSTRAALVLSAVGCDWR